MQISKMPLAKAAMLIRKPAAEVYEAFVNPAITTKFWFTKSSGRLEVGKEVIWAWEMYNVSATVQVKSLDENKRILIEWDGNNGPTTVEWIFKALSNDTTFVEITNSGFGGDGDQMVDEALDSTGGFTWVLAGAKAWLEHNLQLNLIADAFPEGGK
jgi:uncharacterized protein YndB with AHSA1/START domain